MLAGEHLLLLGWHTADSPTGIISVRSLPKTDECSRADRDGSVGATDETTDNYRWIHTERTNERVREDHRPQ